MNYYLLSKYNLKQEILIFIIEFILFLATLIHNQTPPPPVPTVVPAVAPQQAPNPAAAAAAAAAVAAAAAAGAAPPRNVHNIQTHEMNIPNDLIGCIIGRGGQKISEIR